MPTVKTTPTTAGHRFATKLSGTTLSGDRPDKRLTRINKKHSGRNSNGRVTVRGQGGRHKRLLREIDWKRRKVGMIAEVKTIEYDPNRTANIALLQYDDGTRTYILAPVGMFVGDKISSGEIAEIKPGNALPVGKIPVGSTVHCLELQVGKGAQLARSAGNGVIIQGREDRFILVKLPSGEVRRVSPECFATIGQVSNPDWKLVNFGKAGRKRRMGVRPTVRGVAQHPGSHPHGGGEGRSGIGMPSPKSPWGWKALGVKTRNRKKYSNKYIVKDRRVKR